MEGEEAMDPPREEGITPAVGIGTEAGVVDAANVEVTALEDPPYEDVVEDLEAVYHRVANLGINPRI